MFYELFIQFFRKKTLITKRIKARYKVTAFFFFKHKKITEF